MFIIQVFQINVPLPFWQSLIYNFSLGQWEQNSASTADGEILDGWTFWESHGIAMDTNCPNIPRITATNVMVFLDGVWQLISPSLSVQSRYGNFFDGPFPAYSIHVNNANYNWEAYTP